MVENEGMLDVPEPGTVRQASFKGTFEKTVVGIRWTIKVTRGEMRINGLEPKNRTFVLEPGEKVTMVTKDGADYTITYG